MDAVLGLRVCNFNLALERAVNVAARSVGKRKRAHCSVGGMFEATVAVYLGVATCLLRTAVGAWL